MRELHTLGIGVGDTASDLEQAQVLAEEAERAVGELADRVRPDPTRLEHVENRLALLERLALKYGGSVEAVLEHRARLQAEREQLEGVEDDIVRLEEEQKRLAAQYLALAKSLSRQRVSAAERFSGKVIDVLKGLGIPRARLRLTLVPRISASGTLEVDGARIEPAEDGIDAVSSSSPPTPAKQCARWRASRPAGSCRASTSRCERYCGTRFHVAAC